MSLRKKLERLAFASADTSHCPDSDTFAQFILGELDETAMSQVGLHVHSCPICSADYAVFRERPIPRKVAFSWSALLGAGAGVQAVRGAIPLDHEYKSAELTFTLSVSPDYEGGELYRLTGWLLQGEEVIPDATVKLRGPHKKAPIRSDVDGSFSFESLYTGTYTLTVITDNVELVIRDIAIGNP